jgi:hypothetical protein
MAAGPKVNFNGKTTLSFLDQRVIGKINAGRLQVALARRDLGGNDLVSADIEHHPIDIGQLQPVFVDAVEERVAFKHKLLRGWRRPRAPGFQRRQVGIFRPVLARHLRVQRYPVIYPLFGSQFGQAFRSLILLMETTHVVRWQEQPQRHRRGQGGQEIGQGQVPCETDRGFVEHLKRRATLLDHQFPDHPTEFFVMDHVFPAIAEILGGEGMPVRPAMTAPQSQGKDPPFLDLVGCKDIGHEVQVLVEADKPRIAVERHVSYVALPADQHPHSATMPTGNAAHLRQLHDARLLRQSVADRWNFPRCQPLVKVGGPYKRLGRAGTQRNACRDKAK